jgi:hypothetical protein
MTNSRISEPIWKTSQPCGRWSRLGIVTESRFSRQWMRVPRTLGN